MGEVIDLEAYRARRRRRRIEARNDHDSGGIAESRHRDTPGQGGTRHKDTRDPGDPKTPERGPGRRPQR